MVFISGAMHFMHLSFRSMKMSRISFHRIKLPFFFSFFSSFLLHLLFYLFVFLFVVFSFWIKSSSNKQYGKIIKLICNSVPSVLFILLSAKHSGIFTVFCTLFNQRTCIKYRHTYFNWEYYRKLRLFNSVYCGGILVVKKKLRIVIKYNRYNLYGFPKLH